MKREDIRSLSADELRARVEELREEQFRLRFRSATETLESPLRLREVRRDIARALTILGEKQRGVEPQAKAAKPTSKAATKKTATKGTAKTASTKTASKRAAKTARTETAR